MLYLVRYDSDDKPVEAPTFGKAVEIWRADLQAEADRDKWELDDYNATGLGAAFAQSMIDLKEALAADQCSNHDVLERCGACPPTEDK